MQAKISKITVLLAFFIVFTQFSLWAKQEAQPLTGIERLKKQIQGIIRGTEGEIGVAVKHLESGQELARAIKLAWQLLMNPQKRVTLVGVLERRWAKSWDLEVP